MSVNEKLRRLSMRGKVEVRLEMQRLVAHKWVEIEHDPPRWPHGPARVSRLATVTEHNEVPSPIWKVSVDKFKRRYPATTDSRIKAWVYDQFGFNSEFAEGTDLDALLDRLLMLTRPKHVDPMFDYCPGQFIRPVDREPGEPEFVPRDGIAWERSGSP